ncbi:MAG: SDR family oxidoreductase [Anaerolineales bacterium]|jgi:UDP-glucose 4-epimerase
MKSIVTGGAGFIGSHLVGALLMAGHQVTVLDNFITGRKENLADHAGSAALKVIEADIADHDAMGPHFDGVDWVFHLAALAEAVPSIERPMAYFRTNVMGTVSVLEAARLAGAKRFIYAASASCYGMPKELPTTEKATIQPQHPYGLTKWQGEGAAMHWHQVYGLPAVSLRFFNVYGLRLSMSGTYGAVFGIFLAQKLANKPFTVIGDGNQSRDFVYVSDVVTAFIETAQSDVAGEAMNVGSGSSTSINRVIELLGGQALHIPERPVDPHSSLADITKIRSLIGWEPEVSFEQGISVLLENIDDWREARVWTADAMAEATRDLYDLFGAG